MAQSQSGASKLAYALPLALFLILHLILGWWWLTTYHKPYGMWDIDNYLNERRGTQPKPWMHRILHTIWDIAGDKIWVFWPITAYLIIPFIAYKAMGSHEKAYYSAAATYAAIYVYYVGYWAQGLSVLAWLTYRGCGLKWLKYAAAILHPLGAVVLLLEYGNTPKKMFIGLILCAILAYLIGYDVPSMTVFSRQPYETSPYFTFFLFFCPILSVTAYEGMGWHTRMIWLISALSHNGRLLPYLIIDWVRAASPKNHKTLIYALIILYHIHVLEMGYGNLIYEMSDPSAYHFRDMPLPN